MREINVKTKGILFQHPETGETIRSPRIFYIKDASLPKLEVIFRTKKITDYEITEVGDDYNQEHIIPTSKVLNTNDQISVGIKISGDAR